MEDAAKSSHLLGRFMKVGLAYALDSRVRYLAASGGAVTSLLRYALDSGQVEAVLAPRLRVHGGSVFGVYEIVRDPRMLVELAGSIYAPVSIGDALRDALNEGLRIALVGLPCLIRGLREALQRSRDLEKCVKVLLGLYCYGVPSPRAFEYAARTVLKIDPREVSHVAFRGCGWPGYTTVTLRTGKVLRVRSQAFWGSGFGQYFYGKACFLCDDHTAELADASFADPWTYARDVGAGKTLTVIRSRTGLALIDGAVRSGYLVFEELSSHLLAVQYTTLLKKAARATSRRSQGRQYVVPPSIETVLHELDYLVGSSLARREALWPLLRAYVKARPYLLKPLLALDRLLGLGFSRLVVKISRAWST